MKTFSSLSRTLALATGLSLLGGYVSFMLQSRANARVSSCSYMDPLSIDIVAFFVAGFLFIEALVSIIKHKESGVAGQVPRCLRMAIGTSIFVIHFLQVLHK